MKKEYFYTLADRLDKLINETGTTYTALGKFVECERKTIGSWRYGTSMPSALGVKLLAQYFNVSADWLLGLTNDRSAHLEP